MGIDRTLIFEKVILEVGEELPALRFEYANSSKVSRIEDRSSSEGQVRSKPGSIWRSIAVGQRVCVVILNASTTRKGLAWKNGRSRKVGIITWKSLGEGGTRQNVSTSIILNLPSKAGTEIRRRDHVLSGQLLDALAADLA